MGKFLSDDPDQSYGRLASFMALVSCIVWQSYLVWRISHATGVTFDQIRQAITDIPNNWLLVIFIPYGISKAPDVIEKFKVLFGKGAANGIPDSNQQPS